MGHGSGQSTKNESAAFVNLWRPLGYAVLRYDKRGVGQSTGVYRPVSTANSPAQIAELAGDMLAGVAFLKTRPEIDGSRIGLMGVSQAGWLMASAAGQSPDVRFFVAAVGSVMPIGQNIFYENLRTVPIEEAYEQLAAFSGPEGWDPLPSLRAATAPGIWLLADQDRLVPTRICLEKLRALRGDGHRYTARVYSGFGHELGGSSAFWPDVASWLQSEGLR
jgi:pimeloyl-ACP methyl ester carboxylesterase